MNTGRLEAFSDGVLAIIITIMVLGLKLPENTDWESLKSLLPSILVYAVSFLAIAVYWNNHHHLFQVTKQVNWKILWANHHLLFWLSLVPFTTSWVAEHFDKHVPVTFYGLSLIMSAIAYIILEFQIIKHHDDKDLKEQVNMRRKGNWSLLLYIVGIAASFFSPFIAMVTFTITLIIWLVPNKKIEKAING